MDMTKRTEFHREGTLLLVLCVPQAFRDGRLFFEQQACNGLQMWSTFFSKVVVATPLVEMQKAEKSVVWKPVDSILAYDRIEFVQLPQAFHPMEFFKVAAKTCDRLRHLIDQADYLQFVVGGLFGDFGSLAAKQARDLNRKYAVHMDWVCHRVLRENARGFSWKNLCKRILYRLTGFWNNWQIRHANLVLCHGKTVYDYYKKINPRSFLIHNVHTKEKDWIDGQVLEEKKAHAMTSPFVSICYFGQMIEMKAPMDWLKALAYARDLGANFKATWYGDGPLFRAFVAMKEKLGLENSVASPGWVVDRRSLLQNIETFDVFLMTHISDESPRSVIEALVKGMAVVGYESAYAREIMSGACLQKRGDWKALGKTIANLCSNRAWLTQMIEESAVVGRRFSDEKVFSERALLIKRHLR